MSQSIDISGKRKIFKKFTYIKNGVLSPEEFRTLVDYERTRSDRNGGIFSVVVFYQSNGSREALEKLILKIPRYARSIDRTGWSGKGDIAVLLPDTTKEGAAIFGEKLLGGFGDQKDGGVLLDVYSYPEHWFSNRGGDGSGRDLKNSIENMFVYRMPAWKRSLDLFGSIVLLILTSPIFLALSLYIKLVSPGPVFFKQTRIGYKGVPFAFWKFRTMKPGNNESFHGKHAHSFITNGEIPMEKLDNKDPRIIFGGRVIRKSCMDELPQLWNILKGEMSLVGPRPCIPYEAEEYLRWHTQRFDTMPGLTGLWQVSGKNKLTFKQMIRLDIEYCRSMSFLGDVAIILRTPVAILRMILEAVAKKLFPNRVRDNPGSLPLDNAHVE